MRLIDVALIAEGTSDAVLTRPIRWLCSDIDPVNHYEVRLFDFQNLSTRLSLETKVQFALRDQPSHHLILIHRDQDNAMRDE